jgi:hypothetical protein
MDSIDLNFNQCFHYQERSFHIFHPDKSILNYKTKIMHNNHHINHRKSSTQCLNRKTSKQNI